MPQIEAPAPPRGNDQFVDRNGLLTERGRGVLDGLWRQLVAGHVNIPVAITNSGNVFTLVPKMHEEGAQAYGNYMVFVGVASAGSTGAVTAKLQTRSGANGGKVLSTIKVYKDGGSTQAGNLDIVSGRLYLWIYRSDLDSGVGGFVLK